MRKSRKKKLQKWQKEDVALQVEEDVAPQVSEVPAPESTTKEGLFARLWSAIFRRG